VAGERDRQRQQVHVGVDLDLARLGQARGVLEHPDVDQAHQHGAADDGHPAQHLHRGVHLLAQLRIERPARFVDRRDPALPSTVRNALFTFPRPVGGKPVTRAVPLPEGGYAVVTFTQSRTMPTAGDAQLRGFRVQQITAGQGQAAVGAYIEELRSSAKVEKNPRAFQ
jgi:hypothetical protein